MALSAYQRVYDSDRKTGYVWVQNPAELAPDPFITLLRLTLRLIGR